MNRNGPGSIPGRFLVTTTALSLLRNPDIIALIAYVGAVSREIGYRQAEDDMARLWRDAHRATARVLRQPTHAELQRRRYAS